MTSMVEKNPVDKSLDSEIDYLKELESEFVVHGKLGHGGQAQVFNVTRRCDGRRFAVKAVDTRQQAARYLIRYELTVLEKLKGFSWAVNMVGYRSCSSHTTITMELCACSLHDRIKSLKHGMNDEEAATLVYNLATALHALHKKNIVHGDMKTRNILLTSSDRDYEVKLADFGMARIVSRRKPLIKGSPGTPRYKAPEMFKSKTYGKECDVWGLGLILYEAMTAQKPFHEIHCGAEVERVVGSCETVPLCFNRVPSHGARELLKRMLDVEPCLRMTCRKIMRDPWVLMNARIPECT